MELSSVVVTPIQKRFSDVDILGHVNNVNLQHYFDVGKLDYFTRVLGAARYWQGEGIITAATNTSYLAQTRMEEDIAVETAAEKVGNKSFTLLQRIISVETREVKAESRSVMVSFDFDRQESTPVPDRWKEAMTALG